MNESYINNHYDFLLKNRERLKTDEKMVRGLLEDHLLYVPQKLYKYRTCNRNNFSALKNEQIYMPSAIDFKDPFDYTFNFDTKKQGAKFKEFFYDNLDKIIFATIKDILPQINAKKFTQSYIKNILDNYFLKDGTCLNKKFEEEVVSKGTVEERGAYKIIKGYVTNFLQENSPNMESLAEKIVESIEEMSDSPRQNYLVYCLTEDKSSGPMWENYANNYQGFCVEYDFSDWKSKSFVDIKNLIFLLPVIYSKKKPSFNVDEFFELAVKKHFFKEDIGRNIELDRELNKQLLRKQKDYDYEKEWRFSIKNEGCNLQPFPFVSAIYMGKDISQQNIKHLKVVAKKLKIDLYQQKLSTMKNRFRYEKVDL